MEEVGLKIYFRKGQNLDKQKSLKENSGKFSQARLSVPTINPCKSQNEPNILFNYQNIPWKMKFLIH